MSYIRTKNRIYQVESVLRDNGFVKGYNVGEIAFIRKDQVINQSENIEELCDEFVIEYLTSEEVIQIRYPEFQWAKEDFESNKKGTLYGAIRVSGKGLIYVAKMNESGELELI